MKKRIINIILALAIVLSAVAMASCSATAPDIEDLRDRFIYLIEGSKELNVIYFGKGLPTYKREDTLSGELGIYYNDELVTYDKVMECSKYISIDEIKKRSEEIYSTEYLSALYETAFDGFVTGGSSAYLRFYESADWIYQNTYATDFALEERIYDYSSMTIVKPSNSEYVNITVNSYTVGSTSAKEISLTFVYERGSWYLDSPTY